MNKLTLSLCGLALAALPCTSALASELDFSFSGAQFSASGTFTYAPTSTSGVYLISNFTGTADILGNMETITGIAPVNGFAGNDNLVYIPPTFGNFDFDGAAFFTTGDYAINMYNDPDPFESLGVASNGARIGDDENAPVTVTIPTSVTPEPGSLALLGTGALGVVGLVRRKLAV